MNATPRIRETWNFSPTDELIVGRELVTVPASEFLVLECEVQNPPSAKGRTVYVYFDVEQTTLLVKAAREAAIAQRSATMNERTNDVNR